MTKAEFLLRLAELYKFCNLQDIENKESWTCVEMVEEAGCSAFDQVIKEMRDFGALTPAEAQLFYDELVGDVA